MKLLDWMHHKFQHSSIEPFKGFIHGNPCFCLSAQASLDEQDSYMKPSFGSTHGSRTLNNPKSQCEKCFSDSEAKGEEGKLEEQASTVISELFHGFLTIGTLGLEPLLSEPLTPTFAMAKESKTENKTELTENDLKLINYELEKFLEAETEEWCNDSSGRNSQASIITLSANPLDEDDNEDYEKIHVCPLQGYLLGSSIEQPETINEVKKERTSLAGLFQRTKITNENKTEKNQSGNMQAMKKHKPAMHLMKKILKKLHAFLRSSVPSAGGDATDSTSTKKILHKVISVFHKKIHPEASIAAKEFADSDKYKLKNAPHGGYKKEDKMHLSAGTNGPTLGSMSKMGIPSHKTPLYPTNDRLHGSNLSAKEHWIKTDVDYLVLEL